MVLNKAPAQSTKARIKPEKRSVDETLTKISDDKRDREAYLKHRGDLMVAASEIVKILEKHNSREIALIIQCKKIVEILKN